MIKKIQLKNGLKVILIPSAKSPVISVQMWVRTGSVDETKGLEGLSHFIEHLVFKGTRKYGVGEIASTVEGSGGELNAYTSFDQTVFYVTISKSYFETGLDVISEMMGFPKFDPKEIDNEREVVLEEIKRGNDSLGRQASQLLFKTAYKKSAYRIPVIGYEKNIQKASAAKISQFYRDRYTPPNMFLLITGDFELKSAQKKVTDLFSKIPKTPLRKIKRVAEPTQKAARAAVISTKFHQSIGYCAWKIPGAGHKDIPALDALALILGQGDSSRLVGRLRIDEPLVNSIGMGNYLPQEGGLMMLSFGFEKDKLPKIRQAVNSEFEKFLKEGPSIQELQKAIINLESGEQYSLETVDGLANHYGSVEFQFRDLKAIDRYLKALRQLTPKDIQKVALKYLKHETASFAITSHGDIKNLKSETKKWIQDLKKMPRGKIVASPKKIKLGKLKKNKPSGADSHIEEVKLSSGARVLLRHSTETSVISAKVAFLGGLRYEAMADAGVSEVFSRSWLGGTSSRTESQLSAEIDQIACGISPTVGRNSAGMSLDVLNNFEEKGQELFLDSLCNPLFPELVIEREKTLQLQQIAHKKDHPSQIVFNQFLAQMFEGHPYAKDPLGTVEGLARINHARIQEFWKKMLSAGKMHFVLAGNFDKKSWLEKIEMALETLPQKVAPFENPQLGQLKRSSSSFEKAEKEQAHLVYGFRSYDICSPNRHVLQVIQAILAGQGGRLFLELRDKESLAYSVSPTRLEGIEGGYFGAYIGCSPEKTKKALEMMKIEFQKLVNIPVHQEELDRAKRYIIGKHDIDLQKTSAVAASILYENLYGLDYNETFHYSKVIQAITAEDIQRVAKEVFSGNSVVAVVGPESSRI